MGLLYYLRCGLQSLLLYYLLVPLQSLLSVALVYPMKSFWHPRSLAQLVLVSFFAALAPLAIAILFSVQSLANMADKNRDITQVVVDATRLGQEVQQGVLEIERRARQYEALSNPELATLFALERARLMGKLLRLQKRIPSDDPSIDRLLESLNKLELEPHITGVLAPVSSVSAPNQSDLDHAFTLISSQSKAVAGWLQDSVDQLLQTNVEQANAHIWSLVVRLTLLGAASLGLLLLLARWINKPVKALTQEIHNLGTSGLSHPIEIAGPLEFQALGSELEWLRRGLHEADQQKQLFLRHISHELKTPLCSLREGADLLAEQVTGHLSQQQLEIVEIMRDNSVALQRLIENLIDLNRLPYQDLLCEEFELRTLWHEVLGNYSISLNKKALQLQQCDRDITWVADKHKLKTSLDNLISNAINYTPEGGIIDVLWRSNGHHLIIDVANSGEPIPAQECERIFEPFFQSVAKRSGPVKGSGIGLSVARECIEAQGGSLSLARHARLPVCFRLICPAH